MIDDVVNFLSLSLPLPEALQQTNISMKERFEGLSVWREKQRDERDFLEKRLMEAKSHMEALTLQNQELSQRLEERGGVPGGPQVKEPHLYFCFLKPTC